MRLALRSLELPLCNRFDGLACNMIHDISATTRYIAPTWNIVNVARIVHQSRYTHSSTNKIRYALDKIYNPDSFNNIVFSSKNAAPFPRFQFQLPHYIALTNHNLTRHAWGIRFQYIFSSCSASCYTFIDDWGKCVVHRTLVLSVLLSTEFVQSSRS